jgi:hypothetical protein
MIKIRNKKKTGFQNEKAIFTNTKYVDEIAKINNIKKSSKKIELEEDFVMPERTDIDKNVFTSKTGTKDWKNYVKSDEKNVNMVNDYATVISAEKEFKKDYKYLAHENFKYEKRLEQEIQRHSPINNLTNNFKQLINAFGVSASMLNQLELVQSIAKIIAPPPTAEQIATIKKRLSSLDVSILTDYYTLSQIVQTPELQNVIKAMYEQFEKITNSPESKFIISLVKHIMDYIILNQNKFGMPQYLQSIYNKYFGNLNINPNAPVVEPTNQPITFGHDQTLAPSERITAPPTAAPISGAFSPGAGAIGPTPATAAPTSMAQAPSFNPEQVGEIIKTYFELAFSDRAQLEAFYNSLANGTTTVPELNELSLFMRDKVINTTEATLTQLIQPLLDGLNSLSYVDQSIKNYIVNKGRLIIANNAFFFQQRQTLTPPPQPSESPISSTYIPPSSTPRHHQLGSSTPMEINQDLQHVINRFNESMTTNIATLKTLYFDILDKKDPIINKYSVLYDTLLRLDKLYEVDADVAPGKLFIINLFNAFNNLNYPGLNDFKQMLRSKADVAMLSPNYQVAGALDIPPMESFTPINYVRPYNVQPSTIAQPYNEQPKLLSSTNAPVYTAQPTTGPQIAPSPQVITTGAASLIKQTPTKMKVKITKSQATKIIETIINNSTNTTDLINGISQTDEILNSLKSEFNIERGLEIGSMVIAGLSLLAAFKKYYSGKKGSREENLRLLSEQDIERNPSMAEDAIPIIAQDGKSLGVKPTTVGRLIQIGKNLNPISIAHSMFNYARNLMRAGSEEEVRAATERATTELTEINIEPTAGPSEAEARRRIKEAMTKVKEINLKKTQLKKKVGEGSGLTQKQKDELIQEENIKLKEELAQLKAKESERVVKRAAKSVVSNIITEAAVGGVINQIVEQMSVYENRVNAFLNKAQQPREFKTFEKYKTFYDVVQDLSTNIRAILINLGLSETDVFGVPFNALAGQGSTKYNSINDQFIKKDYTTLIKKIQGWLNIIGPLMNQNEAFNKLYYVILNMQSIINKNQV